MPERNAIIGVAPDGLSLSLSGAEVVVPWSAVTEVGAGRAKLYRHSENWILVLAVGVEADGEHRAFVVGEVEPVWLDLTRILPEVLTGVPPFETWGAAAVTASAPVQVYRREKPPI